MVHERTSWFSKPKQLGIAVLQLLSIFIGLLPGVIVPVFIEFTGFYLELSFQYLWSSLASTRSYRSSIYRVHWLLPGVIVPVFIQFTGFYLELSFQYL